MTCHLNTASWTCINTITLLYEGAIHTYTALDKGLNQRWATKRISSNIRASSNWNFFNIPIVARIKVYSSSYAINMGYFNFKYSKFVSNFYPFILTVFMYIQTKIF